MIDIGHLIEIRPAYNSETGERDIWDEIAGCYGIVREHGRNGEHRVELLDGSEAWVYVARLRER